MIIVATVRFLFIASSVSFRTPNGSTVIRFHSE